MLNSFHVETKKMSIDNGIWLSANISSSASRKSGSVTLEQRNVRAGPYQKYNTEKKSRVDDQSMMILCSRSSGEQMTIYPRIQIQTGYTTEIMPNCLAERKIASETATAAAAADWVNTESI